MCWAMAGAAPRSEQEALGEAFAFMNSGSMVFRAQAQSNSLTLAWTAMQDNGQPAFYVFNRGTNDGFILISAEDRTRTVLGYADSGTFSEADMPINMRYWLQNYSRMIAYAATLPALPDGVRKAPQRTHAYTPIEAICQTKWNQGDPYNQKCPYDSDNKRSVTGCAATAAAQVMKAHNHPVNGVGSHSYVWTNSADQNQTLSVDFGNTTYDWANMTNTYSFSSKPVAKNAVSTLMYHCGVACDMDYSSQESGASAIAMMNGLVSYFDYDPGIRCLYKDYMGEKAFLNAIIEDLQAGRPVYFAGFTPRGGGHAFVCDGLDADGLVHINWGWGGNCDGHFQVSVLNPDDQGIGGSATNDSYTEGVSAYTQIRPNAGGAPTYTITADAISITSLRFSRNTAPELYADVFSNKSISTWAGKPSLLVYKNGELYKAVPWYYSDMLQLDPGYYYTSPIPISASLSSIPAGEYELVPGVSISGQSNVYVPLYVLGYGAYRCPMTVTSSEIILELPQKEESDPEVPSVAYLSERYDTENNVVLCMTFDDAPCYDVYFVGTPNNWGKGSGSKENFANCAKFEALPDYEGWYVVSFPYSSGVEGKPIQAEADGSFSWNNQSGDKNAWINRGGSGSKTANVTAGYSGEANVGYPSAGCYIYELGYWKNHENIPCDNAPKYEYLVAIYAPDGCEGMKPAIIGSFNNWSEGVAMAKAQDNNGDIFYYAYIEDRVGGEFKFREASSTDWSNELQYYDAASGEWKVFANFKLPAVSEDMTVVYDFSYNTRYRYAQCQVEIHDIWVGLILPDNSPSAVDIVGSFDAWEGTPLMAYPVNDIWYTSIRATSNDYFAVVEHGNWSNYIQILNDHNEWETLYIVVSDYMKEESDGKFVTLNMSNSDNIRWKADEGTTDVKTVQSDVSSGCKLLRDGQLLIMRDGMLFTPQGIRLHD